MSQRNNVPLLTSSLSVIPTRSFMCMGWIPVPGLTSVSIDFLILVPLETSVDIAMLFLISFLNFSSDLVGPFLIEPKAFSIILTLLTRSANSLGSIIKLSLSVEILIQG